MDAKTARIRQLMAMAEQACNTAQVNLDAGDFRATVNRAYYAVFYAASAVLLTKGIERRRHSGVIGAIWLRGVLWNESSPRLLNC